ncbi:prolipoprotein diacylglyceryl transferase family protein [Clostridiisalibacter paucivorans]|uniref:prolipoprotein diacylglyceryl transferase family protein n=1 Tax=Clostridiisalibacter paucivorans TaxID=408753 RepID=UPI00047B96CF|nr:prolipoprotein diacylglyceryl transferase family protein [Clostridiisalibacter paucivorans]
MRPFFFVYKNITITWFLAFTILGIFIGYMTFRVMFKGEKSSRDKIEDLLFTIIFSGFIFARLFYVIFNIDMYRDNIFGIFKLSHYNLSFIGGVVGAIFTMVFFGKKNKKDIWKLFNAIVPYFYITMSIVIWTLYFEIGNIQDFGLGKINIVLILSLISLGLFIFEIKKRKKEDMKISLVIFTLYVFIINFI